MKKLIRPIVAAVALSATLAFTARAEEPGFVDFGKFTPTSSDKQFVEVNIKSNLIAMVSALTRKAEPEIAKAIEGIKQIRVNVLELADEGRDEVLQKVADIRQKLDKTGWDTIVTAIEKDQDVRVFLKLKDAQTIQGLAVTVVEGKQVVLVNLVGDIQPEKLATVGERFNIEPLKNLPPIKTPEREKPAEDADKS